MSKLLTAASLLSHYLRVRRRLLRGRVDTGEGQAVRQAGIQLLLCGQELRPGRRQERFRQHGTFRDYNLSNYIEYGLTNNLTLINSMVYKHIDKNETTADMTTWGVGDIDVAARYKLAEGNWGILSGQALLKIPSAYDKNDRLPLGNGQFDYEGKLLYGKSLYPHIPGYVNLELGYRFRDGDPSDEFRYLVEFGIDVTKSIYGRLKLDGIYSIDNGNKFAYDGNPTTTNNFDLGKLEVTAAYSYPRGV